MSLPKNLGRFLLGVEKISLSLPGKMVWWYGGWKEKCTDWFQYNRHTIISNFTFLQAYMSSVTFVPYSFQEYLQLGVLTILNKHDLHCCKKYNDITGSLKTRQTERGFFNFFKRKGVQ